MKREELRIMREEGRIKNWHWMGKKHIYSEKTSLYLNNYNQLIKFAI